MSQEEIPLILKDITMLTTKIDQVATKVEEEARKAQLHREESLRFHADLLEKLETKFAGKWTEKVLVYIGTWIWLAILTSIMALILKK